jgi:hypothetical protein
MAERPSGTVPTSVVFNYVKSNYFRVIYATGAYGGITPTGMIHFCLYSERVAIPRIVRQKIDEDGRLSPEMEILETREGLVREMEADVIMDLASARSLHEWLGEKINTLETAQTSRVQP